MQLNDKQLARIAGFELNALNLSRVLPLSLEGARIEDAGTIIHDLDGEPERIVVVGDASTIASPLRDAGFSVEIRGEALST